MEITQQKKDDVNIISINGRLDASTANSLEESLEPFNQQQKIKLVVNCEQLEYISSAGLRVLLACAKQFQKNHSRISLTTLNANVKQVFEISGFTSIFHIYNTIDEAINDIA